MAVAVLDFGKTRAKLTCFSPEGERLLRLDAPTAPLRDGPWRLDIEGLERWAWGALAKAARQVRLEAIVPVGHGAAAVLTRGDDPVLALDYEAAPPDDLSRDYEALRDPFEATLSPSLPQGLNLGRQLFWLERLQPEIWPAAGEALLWPQYWGWRLTGERVSEVTSLGCHSDLWRPRERRFSDLALGRGWAGRLGPLRSAGEVLGKMRGDLGASLGLPPTCRVLAGLHDSNAALLAARALPQLAECPFALVSTGTWFVVMASGGQGPARYDPARDMLANVDVAGRPVPTARFMGGRAYEAAMGEALGASPDLEALDAALAADPADAWAGRAPPARAARAAALLARRTAEALDLIAAEGPILLEGRFAPDPALRAALAALLPGRPILETPLADGVATGAFSLSLKT